MKRVFRFCFGFTCLLFMAGCGMQTKEVFYINPDLSGKCLIEAKMFIDTTKLDAGLEAKDSLYGIIPSAPDFHRMKFTAKDAGALAINIINIKGIEVWNSIRFGMSKARDMIYFSGTAYFRNINRVHFSMLDSILQVSKGTGNQITFRLEPKASTTPIKNMTDDDISKKVSDLRKNAFYIRPVLADILNPTEATITYNLPGKISNASILGEQGDHIVELTLTGNEILRYADSLAKNQSLAVAQYKATNGTNLGVLEPLFNRIVWGMGVPIEVTFDRGDKPLFDYNQEEQNAMVYFDDFMRQSKLQKMTIAMMQKDEKEEKKRPQEYGELMVNKTDSAAKKPYFTDMTVIQSHDTISFSGELSQDIKADENKMHIQKLIAGTDMDITDSIMSKNKIEAQLLTEDGKANAKGPFRKVNFIIRVHFPPGCKELSVQGRLSTTLSGKPGVQVPFKIKQVAVKQGK